ncbi:MAG: hypothetical protein AAFO82_08815 [Bacteroidota bacterium]
MSVSTPKQNQLDSLLRLPFKPFSQINTIEVVDLVDSGATINVLTFDIRLSCKVAHCIIIKQDKRRAYSIIGHRRIRLRLVCEEDQNYIGSC